GLRVRLQRLLFVYSDPARDRRQHTLSVVFIATASGTPVGMDDAAEARIFSTDEIRRLAAGAAGPGGLPLAFDHARILADWLAWRDGGRLPHPGDGIRR
ncbi:MAG: NUDIX hydrolase, partial [Deltaproteobacteria bacterium]